MFGGDSNLQFGGYPLIVHYQKLTTLSGVEHTVSIVFVYVSKILIVNRMIRAHKALYNIFILNKFHKPHSLFIYKYYELRNRNIGLLSRNYIKMSGCFMGIHR